MDKKDFKERYISQGEHLEIEEIFVAANRNNKTSPGNEFHSLTDNESTKYKKDEFKEAEVEKNLVSDEAFIDCEIPQKSVMINDKQPNSTDELSKEWKYSDKSGLQQHTGFQQPTGFQQNSGPQQHNGLQQNTGFQQNSGPQQYNGLQQYTGFQQRTGFQQNSGPQQYNGLLKNTGFQQSTGLQQNTGSQQPTGFQQNTGFQQPTGFQQNSGPQQHNGLQQNTGFQQQNFYPTHYQNYNRDALRNRELNLMTDGVFIVQHKSQRMGMMFDELNPTCRFREEWEFPAEYIQEDNFLANDIGNVFTNNHDIPGNIGNQSQQNSQKFESPNDGDLNSTEKLLEQWKSSQKSEKIEQYSVENAEKVPENQDTTENNNMTTYNELNSTELLLQKWKTSDESRQENQLLARDIENVLKNHEKVITRDKDEKFTLEMEFSPKDLPFNIRVEPAKELKGFTASLDKVDTEGLSQASQTCDVTKGKNLWSIGDRNRNRPAENVLNVGIEVVPLTVDENFTADVDKSVFREQCIRRILKDDHKTKQPLEPVSVVKSGSKNQSHSPIFLRDTPSKIGEELKEEPNTKQNVFERDFTCTKPNDVLQSWVQLMEGFLEDQKARLRRKMYQIDQDDVLGGNDYDYDRRLKSSESHDRSRVYEPTWIEESVIEVNRMISRSQLLFSNGIPQSQNPESQKARMVYHQNKNKINTAKKQGIMKNVKKKENVTTQKSQTNTGKNKNSRKGKKKVVEREGPAVYKPTVPVFKPPPPKLDRERKSFIKDVENPIKRRTHAFVRSGFPI